MEGLRRRSLWLGWYLGQPLSTAPTFLCPLLRPLLVLPSALPSSPPSRTMPSEVNPSTTTDNSLYQYTFSWHLEFDITATDPNSKQAVDHVPLARKWGMDVESSTETVTWSTFNGESLAVGLFGDRVATKLALFWVAGAGIPHLIKRSTFSGALPKPNTASGNPPGCIATISRRDIEEVRDASAGRYNPATHRLYRFDVTLKSDYPNDASVAHAKEVEELAKRVSGSFPFACFVSLSRFRFTYSLLLQTSASTPFLIVYAFFPPPATQTAPKSG